MQLLSESFKSASSSVGGGGLRNYTVVDDDECLFMASRLPLIKLYCHFHLGDNDPDNGHGQQRAAWRRWHISVLQNKIHRAICFNLDIAVDRWIAGLLLRPTKDIINKLFRRDEGQKAGCNRFSVLCDLSYMLAALSLCSLTAYCEYVK